MRPLLLLWRQCSSCYNVFKIRMWYFEITLPSVRRRAFHYSAVLHANLCIRAHIEERAKQGLFSEEVKAMCYSVLATCSHLACCALVTVEGTPFLISLIIYTLSLPVLSNVGYSHSEETATWSKKLHRVSSIQDIHASCVSEKRLWFEQYANSTLKSRRRRRLSPFQ